MTLAFEEGSCEKCHLFSSLALYRYSRPCSKCYTPIRQNLHEPTRTCDGNTVEPLAAEKMSIRHVYSMAYGCGARFLKDATQRGDKHPRPPFRSPPLFSDGRCLKTLKRAMQVREKVERAKEAQKVWATSSFDQRRKLLKIIQRYILDHQELICR
jgi:hypothetical protein